MQTSTHTHTPGPYTIDKDLGILNSRGIVIAQMMDIYPESTEATARLIAAAPALLDALRAALPLLMLTAIQSLATDIDKHDRYAQTADVVRAAIAAATGEDVE